MKLGTATVSAAELRAAVETSMTRPEDKLRSLDELAEECAAWREQGLTVVLVNGAFDVLHVGHLRYLAAARDLGDRLVAAVNSDLSVQLEQGRAATHHPRNRTGGDPLAPVDGGPDLSLRRQDRFTGSRAAATADPRQGDRLHRRNRPGTGGRGVLRRPHSDLRRPQRSRHHRSHRNHRRALWWRE